MTHGAGSRAVGGHMWDTYNTATECNGSGGTPHDGWSPQLAPGSPPDTHTDTRVLWYYVLFAKSNPPGAKFSSGNHHKFPFSLYRPLPFGHHAPKGTTTSGEGLGVASASPSSVVYQLVQ